MDRMGPWPWIAELCVVHGERRRGIVLRHGVEGARASPTSGNGGPASPTAAPARRWRLDDDVEMVIAPAPGGQPGSVRVTLHWQPAAGPPCRIGRRYTPYGLLEPLPPD